MTEWNMEENLGPGMVFLTVYTPDYDGELRDRQYSFNTKEIYYRIPDLVRKYKDILNDEDHENTEGLIGINSNSLNSPDQHNIFLEWDRKDYIPPVEKLISLGGTVIETGGGLHFIKEAHIRWDDLRATMEAQNCCQGFIHYSNRRKKACLRVCPKKDNLLRIIHKSNSNISYLYEFIVGEMHKEVSSVNS